MGALAASTSKILKRNGCFHEDPVSRHRKWRTFQGRLAELRCAIWLEQESYKIVGLEATRHRDARGPDIEAVSQRGCRVAFEVKFIGQEDWDFDLVNKSIAGLTSVVPISPYAATNYLLFRAYEAAHQLQMMRTRKIVVLIVDDMTWYRFQRPLEMGWINWQRPTLFEQDSAWPKLRKLGERYPGFPSDLAHVLKAADVWILRHSSQFELRRLRLPNQ